MESFRILFVGDVAPFQTTVARRDAFRELGFSVETVDQGAYLRRQGRQTRRLTYFGLSTPAVFSFNRAILGGAQRFRPDVIWIEKGVYVFPRTLRALRRDPAVLLVDHNTDDWMGLSPSLRLHWRYLLRSHSLYDLHVTSNLHNVREFREAGYPRVHHMELAANPAMPEPGVLPEAERRSLGAPVGFIGHWEPATEKLMLHLVRHGVGLKIFGHNWEKARSRAELREVCRFTTVWGGDYARTAVSFDINLGIVSQHNRSHTATRTFQIPALGAFLLHQRNEVVTRYYKEGVEAEFFDSEDELLEKCQHYLARPEERRRIAAAGRRRCEESGYYETDRVREVIPILREALGERR
jgi:spore maturation protein CgeB